MIVLTVGPRQAGVTRLYAMTRGLLELHGFEQRRIAPLEHGRGRNANIAREMTDERLAQLVRAARGSKVVVRTHRPPNQLSIGGVLRHIESGQLRIYVIVRDPRDIAARMLAVAAQKPASGRPTTVDGVVERLHARLASVRKWCALPSLAIRYDDVAFEDGDGSQVITEDLGLAPVDAEELWRLITQWTPRRRSARRDLHRTELSTEDAERIAAEFADYMELIARGERRWLGALA